jgi:prephenate dehydratase
VAHALPPSECSKLGPEQTTTKIQRILYLGPDLSFSYAAAHAVFPVNQYEHIKVDSFDEIFQLLESSAQYGQNGGSTSPSGADYDYAIVPVANSTNGPVIPVVDLLRRSGDGTILSQLAEHGVKGLEEANGYTAPNSAAPYSEESFTSPMVDNASRLNRDAARYPSLTLIPSYTYDLPVHHYLYVHPDCPVPAIDASSDPPPQPDTSISTTITTLHTHPQVWTQCSRFLSDYFPEAKHLTFTSPSAPTSAQVSGPLLYDHASTSSAASYVSTHSPETIEAPQKGHPAALCSLLAGEALGLKCVAAHVEDDREGNKTTFVVLGHKQSAGSD